MKNKTIAGWLTGFLALTIFSAFAEMEYSTIGLFAWGTFAFAIVAIVRLNKLGDK